MDDVVEFAELIQEVRGAANPACLQLQPQVITYKNTNTGKVETYTPSDIEKLHWIPRARGYCMKIYLKNDTTHRVDGFKDTDYEKLSSYTQRFYGMKLEKKDLSLKGWNWGDVRFNGNTMEFVVDGLTSFEIPLSNVSHSQMAKNEVAITFHPNDDAPVCLMEMCFHVPSDNTSETDPVQAFYDKVMAKADVMQEAGDAITIFTEVQCLTPRGRYDIKIHPTFLQLHGKTFDYKIPYSTVLRLFLLPHRDGRQMYFVVSLDTSIKQGQTRYHFLILLLNKDQEITLKLSLAEQEMNKYEGKLQEEMSGAEATIISQIMMAMVNKKIIKPVKSIHGHNGTHSISCTYRTATGSLYCLNEGLICVLETPVHIRFDDVGTVKFSCSVGSARSYKCLVEMKSGTMYTFVGILPLEYSQLCNFLEKKKLNVEITGKTETTASYSNVDDHDAYLLEMKAEGKERTDDGGNDDNEDESEMGAAGCRGMEEL